MFVFSTSIYLYARKSMLYEMIRCYTNSSVNRITSVNFKFKGYDGYQGISKKSCQ